MRRRRRHAHQDESGCASDSSKSSSLSPRIWYGKYAKPAAVLTDLEEMFGAQGFGARDPLVETQGLEPCFSLGVKRWTRSGLRLQVFW